MREKLKPKLRFNNFENPWNQSLLMDQVEIRRGLTYKPNDVRSSGVRVLRSSNIVDDTFILSDNDVFVDKAVVNIPRISNGDILVTAANGSTKLVGKHAIVENLVDNEIVVHGGFMLLFKTEQNYFVNAWMSSNEYKRVLQFVQGGNGAIGNLSSTVLKSMKMSFPSLQEQTAIGSLLRTLDELIASYKDNLTNYQSLKATMLSKMFPKAGQTVPEIRLDGFEGEWEEKEFGDVVKFYSGLTYKPSDVLSCGTLVLRSSNVRDGELIYIDNVFVNPDIVNCQNVKSGDIVVAVRNGSRDLIGKHALIRSEMPNTVIGAFMTGVRCDNPEFINSLLDTKMFISEIHRNLGSTINQITTGNFKRMKFYFPLKDEQQAIGAYFSNLDNLINSHQEKISQLETLKKKLLQDMFV